jgi:hypothetical protein
MNEEQKSRWWVNINPVFLFVSILISILVFISIIVDDMVGTGPGKISFWEWVGVLIIPLALLAAGAWLHNEQVRYEAIATNQRAQDEALRQYLDQMSNLIVDKNLRTQPPNSEEHLLAQARTTAVLLELDNTRKRRPLKLIYRLHLINRAKPVITLENAALDHADLRELTLHDACLKGVDLRMANLRGANLSGTDLSNVDLRGADLRRANLTNACLKDANLLPYDKQDPAKLNSFHLNGVDPRNIDLSGDDLRLTNLSGAILEGADLSGANLAYANLQGVKGVTDDELARQANSLQGTTMPDGTKHD